MPKALPSSRHKTDHTEGFPNRAVSSGHPDAHVTRVVSVLQEHRFSPFFLETKPSAEVHPPDGEDTGSRVDPARQRPPLSPLPHGKSAHGFRQAQTPQLRAEVFRKVKNNNECRISGQSNGKNRKGRQKL